jgi:hypothetical protein
MPNGLTLWSGWDPRSGASADPSAPQQFADSAPTDPAAGAHYELLAVAARGFRPPQFVDTTALSPEAGTRLESDGVDVDPEEALQHVGLRRVWSLLYREIAQTGPRASTPYGIYLLGVDPPPDATDEDLDAFNDFYTNVHLLEVLERRNALRATRYELVRQVKAPYKGAPRFLAVYEVDEKSASNRRHTGPSYSQGPPVWQRHTTPWRLWYRQLAQKG